MQLGTALFIHDGEHRGLDHAHPTPLRVGMLGIGVVGSGTFRVLARNRQLIRARAGREIDLRMVAARDLPRARQLVGSSIEVVDDAMQVVRCPDIDVVVEVVGGCTHARDWIMNAIRHGKHVVTANKALLAEHGEEIFAAAREHGVTVAFEGAVAVSIPIVKALREGLAANDIEWLAGIVNGTSNFILTRMRDGGASFSDALAQAQQLGYAEADPTFDVEGIDAAHKLALLASIAFGTTLQFDDVHVEGVTGLHAVDHACAAGLGYAIKLLAFARRTAGGLDLRVHPACVPAASLLAHVDGSMNGILVKSDAAGHTMYYGAGAGSEQTASAVVADLIDIARLAPHGAARAVAPLGFVDEARSAVPAVAIGDVLTRHYLRFRVPAGSFSADDLAARLTRVGLTVCAQHQRPAGDDEADVVFIIEQIHAAQIERALSQLGAGSGSGIPAPAAHIRVASLD
jgi:homoserine dehydrogenase